MNYIKPTDAELGILHLLWANGPSTVREINDAMNERPQLARSGMRRAEGSNEVGYTTTLKTMQIMYEKGLLTREEDGRTHRYTAAVQESDTKGALLQNFVETTFKGSAMDLVMQALGNHEASADELDEIKALIAKIEQKQGE